MIPIRTAANRQQLRTAMFRARSSSVNCRGAGGVPAAPALSRRDVDVEEVVEIEFGA
ncbi:hypothetical protein GS426_10975 [Rhodococcus hoagii]|nr:hypothetical protein [Prescottella equi]